MVFNNGHGIRRDIKDEKSLILKEKARCARENVTLKIRKDKKEAYLKSRRLMAVSEDLSAPAPPIIQEDGAALQEIQECMAVFSRWEAEPASHVGPFFAAVQTIRKLVTAPNPPVDAVLGAGALPFLSLALHTQENIALQAEAAWALADMANSQYTAAIKQHPGLVEELSRLMLVANSSNLRECCACCLGNIAGDSAANRLELLSNDYARNGFTWNMVKPETQGVRDTFAWAMSVLFKDTSDLPSEKTLAFVSPLIRQLQASSIDDVEFRANACYALSRLAEGQRDSIGQHNDRAQVLLRYDVLTVFNKIFTEVFSQQQEEASSGFLLPMVKCLGHFVGGSDEQTSAVIDSQFLKFVPQLLKCDDTELQKETFGVCSNIAAGTAAQAEAIAQFTTIIFKAVDAAECSEYSVKVEALYLLCNLLSLKLDSVTRSVINAGAVMALCSNMGIRDVSLLGSVLDGLETLLDFGARSEDNSILLVVEEEGGIDSLEQLTRHVSDDIYKKAIKIIETQIGVEEDSDPNICHDTENDSSFAFVGPRNLFPTFGSELDKQKMNVTFDFGSDHSMSVEMQN